MPTNTPLVLMILDGWGYQENPENNAIAKAHTPQWDAWWATQPHCLLDASGRSVGLPDGQMGNSEVGHMHIGAGRTIMQDFTRINHAIESEDYFNNRVFIQLLSDLKAQKKALHIMGLLSNGGVHSHEDHLFAFLKYAHQRGFKTIYIHAFLDGRDTPPRSALESLSRLEKMLETYPVGRIASICGRYYAMDRDKRFERTALAYALLTQPLSEKTFPDAVCALNTYYKESITDEFIPPTCIGKPVAIESGDGVFFFNFRADRTRQLTEAFVNEAFDGFFRAKMPVLSHFVTMTHYAKALPTEVAFPPQRLKQTLGEVISAQGLSQLRIAETEKYAHVTFFLNGGVEAVFPNEDRILIPSPKAATYDLTPEMSAVELTDILIDALHTNAYDVIICNFANADMVGHTGNFPATVKAIECLDACMKRIADALKTHHGVMLITADHGNAEHMFNENTQQVHTAHTNEPVPLLFVGQGWQFTQNMGTLVDVAPTVLRLLDLDIPEEMTGQSLMEKEHAPS